MEQKVVMQERTIYPDVLRIIAIFAIIVLHVSSKNMWVCTVGDANFELFTIWYSLTRWAVPIFIMISGEFLLDPNKDVSTKKIIKYCKRITISFVGWSIIYAVWNVLMRWDFSFQLFNLNDLYISFYQGPYHFWYLFVILGLYLIVPFLRKIICNSEKREIEYCLLLFGIFSVLLPVLEKYSICNPLIYWLQSMKISSISGYIGLFILGYYLRINFKEVENKWIWYIVLLMAIMAMIGLTFLMENISGERDDFWQGNLSFFVVIQAVSVFFIAKGNENKLVNSSFKKKRMIQFLSKNSFGVYLCHDMFISLLERIGLGTMKFSPIFSVPMISILVLILSYLLIGLLKMGYKLIMQSKIRMVN